jgi:dihydropyrimidine dehydrogenase (NAD+) subunit PreA
MGSSVGQEPKLLEEITSWTKEFAKTPVLVKLTPNTGDITEPGFAAVSGGRRRHLAHQHDQEPHRRRPRPDGPLPSRRQELDQRRLLRPRGEAHRAPHGRGPRARPVDRHPDLGHRRHLDWRDAAEFIALGSTSVQVCTAVMHHGYRIVEDMIEGLSEYLDAHGMKSVNELAGRAVPVRRVGRPRLSYKLIAKIDREDVHRLPALRHRVLGRRAPVHLHGRYGPAAAPARSHARAPRWRRSRRSSAPSRAIASHGSTSRSAWVQPLRARLPRSRVHHDGGGPERADRDVERPGARRA